MEENNLSLEVTFDDVVPFLSSIILLGAADSAIPFACNAHRISSTVMTKRTKKKDNVLFLRLYFPYHNLPNYCLFVHNNDGDGGERLLPTDDSEKLLFKLDASTLQDNLRGVKAHQSFTLSKKIEDNLIHYNLNGKGDNTMVPLLDINEAELEIPEEFERSSPNVSVSVADYIDFCDMLKKLKKDAELYVTVYASGVKFKYNNYGSKDEGVRIFGTENYPLFENMRIDIQTLLYPLSKIQKLCTGKGVIKMYGLSTSDKEEEQEQEQEKENEKERENLYQKDFLFVVSIPVGMSGYFDVVHTPVGLLQH